MEVNVASDLRAPAPSATARAREAAAHLRRAAAGLQWGG